MKYLLWPFKLAALIVLTAFVIEFAVVLAVVGVIFWLINRLILYVDARIKAKQENVSLP
ncbi:multisubunit Na+/H+ antiporter MnhC subunit [Runella defluvii]|uniref:Multisubunit Na+/H+ antiporter MnhC subunit n=1 Tax=Runella defluvii TaxID=370973 RepID=A0A7W6EU43_9BACT|nr:hypothetical protein [Runella defluvii]MBB3842192.1 multisubunit Na+/H+ antiporter MnhC subunit [Runella defluvii]